MLSKNHVIFHMNDIHCIIRVVLFQELKNFKFNPSLIIILLFVLDNFKSYEFLPFMIKALESDTK